LSSLQARHATKSHAYPPTLVSANASFNDLLVEHLPHLRAFARAFTGHRDKADDLVQDAIVRALRAERSFTPGTNLRAWLFTILRNLHYSSFRRGRLNVARIEDVAECHLATPPQQLAKVEFLEVDGLLRRLPVEFREALILVAGAGLSYGEAAAVIGCPVGTAKSRVNRARALLVTLRNSVSDAIQTPSAPVAI
jgi:RNA polymerase sigma-70 factor, ECF subfamily